VFPPESNQIRSMMRDSSFYFSFEISGKTSLTAPLGFTRLGEVLVGFR
jgi:hypothetical protein